jgi:MoaA/NifB/PqqE/SkfB family radical SAM enzyme
LIVCGQIYCTTRCDNHCRFCRVRSPFPGDADFEKVLRNIREIAELRIPYADFAGGNPMLLSWLPYALKYANLQGLCSSLTVSGPMITKAGPGFIQLPSILRFSIDGMPDYHNKSRGEGYFQNILNGLEMAREMRKGKHTQLIFLAIPGEGGNINAPTLNFLLELTRAYRVMVNVNPLFDSKLSDDEQKLLLKFARKADFQVSRGRLRFMARGGNNIQNPTCRAASSVLTISADNKLVLPCYHSPIAKIPLDNGIREVLNSHLWQNHKRMQGRHDFCQGCSIWCYIVPSWIELAPWRLVAWLHALSGLQKPRDTVLRTAGRIFHPHDRYPGDKCLTEETGD